MGNEIKVVISGSRRCGKTTAMAVIMKALVDEGYLVEADSQGLKHRLHMKSFPGNGRVVNLTEVDQETEKGTENDR